MTFAKIALSRQTWEHPENCCDGPVFVCHECQEVIHGTPWYADGQDNVCGRCDQERYYNEGPGADSWRNR